MKNLIIVFLILFISGCQTTGMIKDISKFSHDNNDLHCNLHGSNKYWKNYKNTNFRSALDFNPMVDANWYLAQTWGVGYGRKLNYKHGKSLGVCIHKNGKGYFYTAESSGTAKDKSWVNVSYIIGGGVGILH